MKQANLVILSLLVLMTTISCKGHLSLKHTRVGSAQVTSPDVIANPLRATGDAVTADVDKDPLSCTVNIIKNDQLGSDTGGNLDYTEMCQLKQGYVNVVTDYQVYHTKSPYLAEDHPPILSIKRVFAVLNKQTLSLFENSNVNSLIKTINVQQIGTMMRPRRWEGANCFQVMQRSAHLDSNNIQPWVEVEEPQEGSIDAFCYENNQREEDWMVALRHFQNCDVQTITPMNVNQLNAEVSSQIEKIQCQEESAIAAVKEEALKRMNQVQEEESFQHQEQKEFDGELQSISEDLKIEDAKQSKKKRNMLDEQKKIEDQTEKLEKERECLEKMLRDREQEENNQEQMEIENVEKDKQETLIRQAANVVIQVKQEESNKLEQQHEQYKLEQMRKQDQIKQDMVRKTLQAEMDLPYEVCTDVTDENKQTTFSEVCAQVGAQSPEDPKIATLCLTDDGFCPACCSMHIGLNFLAKRNVCQEACRKAVDLTRTDIDDCAAKTEAAVTAALTGQANPAGGAVTAGAANPPAADEEEGEEEEAAVEADQGPAAKKRLAKKVRLVKKHRFLRKLRL